MATHVAEVEKDTRTEVPLAPAEFDTAPPSRRAKLLPILLGAALIAALIGIALYFHYRNRVSTDDAQVDGHIVSIGTKASGSVSEVLVENNQQVKAGQVLVRIDPRDYQSRVEQAKAALALAESQARGARVGVPYTSATTVSGTATAAAQLAAAEADYERAKLTAEKTSTSEVAYARANVETRQAAYERARADLDRMKPLADKAEISRQQYDAYVSAARVAEGELNAAKEKLASALKEAESKRAALLQAQARVEQARAAVAQSRANLKQVDISSAQASSASAGVAQARANLEAAELQLSYTTITAPIDGQITKKNVEPGQVIQPGQGLMVLVPLHNVWVTANFKETQLADVRPGERAEVHIDMYGQTVTGHVDSIAGATGSRLSLLPPENATGNYVKVVQRIPVKIVLDPLPSGVILRPGMNVDVVIHTK